MLKEMDDEKDAKERYASKRSAEAFGLIPKGFRPGQFSGGSADGADRRPVRPESARILYCGLDSPEEQRMVMSHELTHALQDQQFHIEAWVKAAKPE